MMTEYCRILIIPFIISTIVNMFSRYPSHDIPDSDDPAAVHGTGTGSRYQSPALEAISASTTPGRFQGDSFYSVAFSLSLASFFALIYLT